MKSITVDGYRFVKDEQSGYWQCNQFIAKEGKPKRLHRYVWEKYHGTIKPGYDVHHIDKNKDNNDISNLICLSSHDHQHLHGVEKVKNNPEWFAEFHQRGIESAPKWHASTEGHEWHTKHYEMMKDKLHAKKEFVCEQCGKTFSAQDNGHNRFCSNACKSKWRRNNHIDDVERTCVICGTKFSANKYSKKETCSRSCASKLSFAKRRENKVD